MFLEKWDGCFADLVKGRAVPDGLFTGELGGEVDTPFENVGFLPFGHLVGAL